MKYLILGGVRSGKSRFALSLAQGLPAPEGRFFLATGEAGDEEMARRIAAHQAQRDPVWITVEEPLAPGKILRDGRPGQVFVLDCLTLWLSNVLAQNEARTPEKIDRLAAAVQASAAEIVLVSNEVGLGIVPENPLARLFRDLAGQLNQKMASVCDQVFFLAAGLPLRLK